MNFRRRSGSAEFHRSSRSQQASPRRDSAPIPLCAARAPATLTGEDFGLPKTSGLFDPQSPVLTARTWWEKRRDSQ